MSTDSADENLLVYYGSAHLNLIQRDIGLYRDPSQNNIEVRGMIPAAGSDDACSGQIQAFGYPTLAGTKPGFIVVVCQAAFDKSDMDKNTNLPVAMASWRTSGNLLTMNGRVPAPMVSVDLIEKYMSIKILHEMMHVGDCIKLPNMLPDSKQKEQYGYHQIMAKNGNDYVLSPADKQSNADSYTLAAGDMYHHVISYQDEEKGARLLLIFLLTVWYLPMYYSDSGDWKFIRSADRFNPILLPS